MTEIVKITIRRDYPAGQAAIAPQPNPFTPAPKLVAVGGGEGGGGGGGGGGLTDGDKGDIIVSGGGTALNIDPTVLTASGRALTSAVTVVAQRGALGLGSAALASTTAFDASGTAAAALATHVAESDPHPGYLTEAAATVALAAKADLVGGVVPTSQIPAQAVSDFLGDVASQAAMLALTGQRGDWCIRTDVARTYFLIADAPTDLASWRYVETPGSPVTSVNAQTGVIVLGPADVGATPAAHAGSGGSEHPGAIAGGAAGFMSGADKTKLDGVAANATANASDADLLDRDNHTGTQSAATISDFDESARDVIGTALTGTANRLVVTVNDAGDTITLDVADEGIQDIIGTMVVAAGGSYDDVAGTIVLPSGSSGLHVVGWTPPAGAYISAILNSNNLTTQTGAAGRLDMVPFVPSRTITIDQLAVEVTTAVAASLAKAAIYSADSAGLPDELLAGSSDLDCASTGLKTFAISPIVLTAGSVYWLAVHTSGSNVLRAIPAAALYPLGLSLPGSSIQTLRRATATYASGLPSTAPSTALSIGNASMCALRLA